ncbi:hypothetical protein ACW7G2_03680 [Luteimonas sp. A277]
MIASLLLAILLVSPSSAADDSAVTACPALPERPTLTCVATKHGWFYAASAEAATQAAHDGAEAVAAFRHYLGRDVPFGAVVLADEFPKAEQENFIARHSLNYLRLWIPPESKAAVLEESIRKSMPDLPDNQVRAIVQRASQSSGDVLRHEIGHSLYRAVFWPQHAVDDAIYGTPAPDWLDEASAILLEPEAMLTERRVRFRDLLREGSTSIRPLSEFLTAPHPLGTANQRAQLVAQGGTQTSTGIVMAARSGEAATELSAFYLQSLAVGDFLIEISGKQDLLGDISMALANDVPLDAWLAEHGGSYQLGTDIAELDQQWSTWLDAQL